MNASLNALCAVLLMAGWLFIRRPATPPDGFATERARRSPVAPIRSTAPKPGLTSCVCYWPCSHRPSSSRATWSITTRLEACRFAGGAIRWLYFAILLSHTTLATFGVVPLVALTLFRAARRDFVRHARIAQVTFPIWLYVSVTGVVIYLLLYHLPIPASVSLPSPPA